MHSKESIILFDAVDKTNTDKTIDMVLNYCSTHIDVSMILVSSTTGFTAFKLLSKLRNLNIKELFVFTQYLDEKHNMSDDVHKNLKALELVQDIFYVPEKYLNQEIGQSGVNSLRKLSHGIKVCIEIVHYAQTKQLLKEGKKFIVIAGRVEGADTAVVFKKKKDNVKMIDILCFSREE